MWLVFILQNIHIWASEIVWLSISEVNFWLKRYDSVGQIMEEICTSMGHFWSLKKQNGFFMVFLCASEWAKKMVLGNGLRNGFFQNDFTVIFW